MTVSANVTGSVAANFSSDGTTDTLLSLASTIDISGLPTLNVSALATGNWEDWFAPMSWNDGGIFGLTYATLQVSSLISGILSLDPLAIFEFLPAVNSLETIGPTNRTLPISGIVTASYGVASVSADASVDVTYNVTIPDGAQMYLDQSGVVVNNLTIDPAGTLMAGVYSFTVLEGFKNSGSLAIAAGVSAEDGGDVINSGEADIAGSMQIAGTLVNTGAMTVLTGGSFRPGASSFAFINDGTFDVAGNLTLGWDVPLIAAANSDILRVLSGGVVDEWASFDNTGGTIHIQSSGKFIFDVPGTVTNGLVEVDAGGTVEIGGELDNVRFLGSSQSTISLEDLAYIDVPQLNDPTLLSGTTLISRAGTVGGEVLNFGTIVVTALGVGTDKILPGATLAGGGEVLMSGSLPQIGGYGIDPSISTIYPTFTPTLDNQDNTIIASASESRIISLKLINESSASLEVLSGVFTAYMFGLSAGEPDVQWLNKGTMLAAGGGSLVFDRGTLDNTGGMIAALANSTIAIQNNATITGAGTIAVYDGALVDIGSAHQPDGSDPGVSSPGLLNENLFEFLGHGTLRIRSLGEFSGTISAPLTYGTIDLWQTSILSDTIVGSHLQIATPQQTYSIALTGNLSNLSVQTMSDGVGGTDIVLACFMFDTLIETPAGEVPVQTLRVGDLVTVDEQEHPEPIVWIGRRSVTCVRLPDPQNVWPVRVSAGAIDLNKPRRDLWLSPDHAVYIDDVLIPVKQLINGISIVQVPVDEVLYYHVELRRHDLLIAAGLPVESYLDTGDRTRFANREGVIEFRPKFFSAPTSIAQTWELNGRAPLLITGSRLDAIRERLSRPNYPTKGINKGNKAGSTTTRDRARRS